MPTPDESALSRKLEVLLHESEQVHDTIGRTLGTANSLYGLVLPVAFTVLAFTAGSEDLHFPPALLSSAFAGVVAATLIYNAGLWVEISRYVRYKYRVIYPELHEAAAVAGRQNLGVFLARQHRAHGAGATIAFHIVTQVVTFGVLLAGLWLDRDKSWLLLVGGVAMLLLIVAGVITVSAAREVRENMAALALGGSEPRDESGQ